MATGEVLDLDADHVEVHVARQLEVVAVLHLGPRGDLEGGCLELHAELRRLQIERGGIGAVLAVAPGEHREGRETN